MAREAIKPARSAVTFADLMRLPHDENSGRIELEAILAALPNTPWPVAMQFYADHARKPDHQACYGPLRLDTLSWELTGITAGQLALASTVTAFRRWFEAVAGRATHFEKDGWACIDTRAEVCRQWARERTWLVSPVVLQGAVAGSASEFHVAEGHTRIGLLKGLVAAGVISPLSAHEVWLGRRRPTTEEG